MTEPVWALAVTFLGYVIWNELVRGLLRKKLNGSNPLNGEGDVDERLRALENYTNRSDARSKAQWEELQRTLARFEREQGLQRTAINKLANESIASLAGRYDAMNERLLALERWRHGTPDPMLPQGGAG